MSDDMDMKVVFEARKSEGSRDVRFVFWDDGSVTERYEEDSRRSGYVLHSYWRVVNGVVQGFDAEMDIIAKDWQPCHDWIQEAYARMVAREIVT